MTLELLTADVLTNDVQNQITALYKQLNDKYTQVPLRDILHPDNNVIMVICEVDTKVAGIALLATYKVISGHRGMVEDVVVDSAQRGKGIGRKLMERLLQEGKKLNLDEILLFSGHHRTPAITLYKSLGFALKESGLYSLRTS